MIHFLIATCFLCSSLVILEEEDTDDAKIHHQKTARMPSPPPQTSNAIFSRNQKVVFDNPSPRICEDGSVALKGESCESRSPPPQENSAPSQNQYYQE